MLPATFQPRHIRLAPISTNAATTYEYISPCGFALKVQGLEESARLIRPSSSLSRVVETIGERVLAKDCLFQLHAYATTKQDLPRCAIGVFRFSAYNPLAAAAPTFSCDHV